MHKSLRRTAQRAQLRQDGYKAISMLKRGMKPADVLALIGGSRARLYRAIATVDDDFVYSAGVRPAVDPLLL